MELEHSSETEFMTPNYNIRTCAANEWRIVLNCEKSAEKEYRTGDSRHMRKIPDWKRIMLKEQRQLHKRKDAQLIDVEVIAIILYTGPMVSHSHPQTLLHSLLLKVSAQMLSVSYTCLKLVVALL
jgi:hypothetical protein